MLSALNVKLNFPSDMPILDSCSSSFFSIVSVATAPPAFFRRSSVLCVSRTEPRRHL